MRDGLGVLRSHEEVERGCGVLEGERSRREAGGVGREDGGLGNPLRTLLPRCHGHFWRTKVTATIQSDLVLTVPSRLAVPHGSYTCLELRLMSWRDWVFHFISFELI